MPSFYRRRYIENQQSTNGLFYDKRCQDRSIILEICRVLDIALSMMFFRGRVLSLLSLVYAIIMAATDIIRLTIEVCWLLFSFNILREGRRKQVYTGVLLRRYGPCDREWPAYRAFCARTQRKEARALPLPSTQYGLQIIFCRNAAR